MNNLDQDIESKIDKNRLLIEEMEIQHAALSRDVESLLQELKISADQISACLRSPQNFSQEEWETITNEKKMLDQKLLRELQNISNPAKTKQSYKDRVIQPHWLFVR